MACILQFSNIAYGATDYWETELMKKKKEKQYLELGVAGAIIAFCGSIHAADILFGIVDGDTYVADGNELAGYLTSAGHNVTVSNLWTTTLGDLSSFDQVWVYDLSGGADNNSFQTANYSTIANWYNGLTDQNLIVDGRIISSAWANETNWIQNYALQLDNRGGGLVLGTDHDYYVSGINTINSLIGIDPFTGNFYQPPYEALVDENSPLFLSSLNDCSSSTGDKCINDNSSTSFVPTGLQSNGQTLTPVAFHGTTSDAWNNAAVAATMGSITFGTCGGEGQEPCEENNVPVPTTLALIGLGLAGMSYRRKQVKGA